LHKTIFTHIFCGTGKIDTERKLHTQTAKEKKKNDFLRAETLLRTVFTQQKLFRTEAVTDRFSLMHSNISNYMQLLQADCFYTESSSYAQKHFFIYRRFYTQMPLHGRRIAHSTPLHATSFYTEVLLPLLDHLPITYLSCSPSPLEGLTSSSHSCAGVH